MTTEMSSSITDREKKGSEDGDLIMGEDDNLY